MAERDGRHGGGRELELLPANPPSHWTEKWGQNNIRAPVGRNFSDPIFLPHGLVESQPAKPNPDRPAAGKTPPTLRRESAGERSFSALTSRPGVRFEGGAPSRRPPAAGSRRSSLPCQSARPLDRKMGAKRYLWAGRLRAGRFWLSGVEDFPAPIFLPNSASLWFCVRRVARFADPIGDRFAARDQGCLNPTQARDRLGGASTITSPGRNFDRQRNSSGANGRTSAMLFDRARSTTTANGMPRRFC